MVSQGALFEPMTLTQSTCYEQPYPIYQRLQVGALGGGLAGTVGGVTDGLGNTIQAGGNMVRDSMSSDTGKSSDTGDVESSATETAETAKSKISEDA